MRDITMNELFEAVINVGEDGVISNTITEDEQWNFGIGFMKLFGGLVLVYGMWDEGQPGGAAPNIRVFPYTPDSLYESEEERRELAASLQQTMNCYGGDGIYLLNQQHSY